MKQNNIINSREKIIMRKNNIIIYRKKMINLKGFKEGLIYMKNYNNMTRKITKNIMMVMYFKLKNYRVIIIKDRKQGLMNINNQLNLLLDIVLINMRLKSMIKKFNK